jgi:hypothetical protein
MFLQDNWLVGSPHSTITYHFFPERVLLLSELGGYLASADHAPAGTKRLSNLLHSPKWQSSQIETYLWQRAQTRLGELEQTGEEALVL